MEDATKMVSVVTEAAPWVRSGDKNVDMLRAFKDSEFYDCSFKVGIEPNCKVFKCHKAILSIVSSVFQAMMYGHFREARMGPDDPIALEDTDPDAFDAAMRFIYGNQNSFEDVNLAKRVYIFADKMEITSLSTAIVLYFQDHLNSSNVLGLIDIYKLTENIAALGKCIKVLLEDTEAALRADCWLGVSADTVETVLQIDSLAVDEAEVFQALINWGKAQLKREGSKDDKDETLLRAKVRRFIKQIRFESLSAECAADIIKSANVLSHEEKGCALLAAILNDVKHLPTEWGVKAKRPARKSYTSVSIKYEKGENRFTNEMGYYYSGDRLCFSFSVTRRVFLLQFSLAPNMDLCGLLDKTAILVSDNDTSKPLVSYQLSSNRSYKLAGENKILHPGKKYVLKVKKIEKVFHCHAYTPLSPLPSLITNVPCSYIPVTSLHLKVVTDQEYQRIFLKYLTT